MWLGDSLQLSDVVLSQNSVVLNDEAGSPPVWGRNWVERKVKWPISIHFPSFWLPKIIWSNPVKWSMKIGWFHWFPWVPLGLHGSLARNCWFTDEPNWKVWRFHPAPLPYTYTVGTWEMRESAIINHHFVGVSQSFNIFHHHTDLDTCVFIHAF